MTVRPYARTPRQFGLTDVTGIIILSAVYAVPSATTAAPTENVQLYQDMYTSEDVAESSERLVRRATALSSLDIGAACFGTMQVLAKVPFSTAMASSNRDAVLTVATSNS
jgi:hypothetical protein